MNAWITGGGTGIGKALAEALCRQGWQVAITGRREAALEAAATDIRSRVSEGQITVFTGDVSKPNEVAALYPRVIQALGRVDLLVNNAGILIYRSLLESTVEDFTESLNINVLSSVLCTKQVLPDMLRRGAGTVVNISSIIGKFASPHTPAYSTSKYALTGFTDSLRQGLAGTGIHVMGVYPGYIVTPMTEPYASPAKRTYGVSPEKMAQAILKGLRRKAREVNYPWYVSWAVAFYRMFPGPLEALRRRVS
jgi:uncharacterized protein